MSNSEATKRSSRKVSKFSPEWREKNIYGTYLRYRHSSTHSSPGSDSSEKHDVLKKGKRGRPGASGINIAGSKIFKIDSEQQTDVKSCASLKSIEGKLVCIIGSNHLNGLAQEPWPKDVKLYQPYEVEQILLPDNANCLAVQAFLRMCNLDFEVVARANAEFMSPSGKVPFIKCGAFIVSELEGIVQFVNNKGISLTAGMESEQKSDMRAYMSLVHNVLENAELYLCWCDKETYNEVTKPRNGSVYPWPLNYFQTWSKRSAVCKRLKMLGWYSKTLEDVYQEVENCCQALTDRLEGKEFFFGKNYTEIDALVYGHIYSILTVPKLKHDSNKLASMILTYEKLINHCKLIHKQVMDQDCDLITQMCSGFSMYAPETDPTILQSFVSDLESDPKPQEIGECETLVTGDPDTENTESVITGSDLDNDDMPPSASCVPEACKT